MNVSTPLIPTSGQTKLHCYRQQSLSSWLKSTQLRFRFKVYTYTPKANQQNQKTQQLSFSSNEQIYQEPHLTKLAKAPTQDKNIVEKKQGGIELHQQEGQPEKRIFDDDQINYSKAINPQKQGRGIQIIITPLRSRNKKNKLLTSTELSQQTSSDEQFTLARKRKKINKRGKKQGRKHGRRKKAGSLATRLFKKNN